MNNSKTPKIVVGVGLVAVYATILTTVTLRRHEGVVARSAPFAASAQMVTAPAPVAIPESADALASEASAPVATPAPIAPVNPVRAPEATRPSVASQPKPRTEDVPVANLPSPRPPAPSDVDESNRSNSGTNAVSELAATPDTVTGEAVTSEEEKPSDQKSESTTEVSPAPSGN